MVGVSRIQPTETTTVTDYRMALQTLLENTSDTDLVRKMIGFAADRLMALEVGGPAGLGTARAARSAPTTATATGTGSGRPGLAPSTSGSPSAGRSAAFPPLSGALGLLEPQRTAETALIAVIQEAGQHRSLGPPLGCSSFQRNMPAEPARTTPLDTSPRPSASLKLTEGHTWYLISPLQPEPTVAQVEDFCTAVLSTVYNTSK